MRLGVGRDMHGNWYPPRSGPFGQRNPARGDLESQVTTRSLLTDCTRPEFFPQSFHQNILCALVSSFVK